MLWCVEQLFVRRAFYQISVIHHCHTIGNRLHDRQIMADKQVRQTKFALELVEQQQNLCLNGNIERTDRLIEYQNPRFGRQCAGYRDGKPLYFDADHLSAYGNDLLMPDLLAAITRAAQH